jgi:tetratricopeptide (TPR) repeat protein
LISTYIASNQLTEALGQLQGVLSKNPNNVPMLISSALVYEKMRRFSDARDAYEKVLSVNPDFLAALKALASLYAKRLNELDRAYDLARKARSLGPEDAEIGDTLGWIFYERTDYEQALTLLNESTAKCPDNPEMQFHLGMAHYMMGHTEAARTALRRADNAP